MFEEHVLTTRLRYSASGIFGLSSAGCLVVGGCAWCPARRSDHKDVVGGGPYLSRAKESPGSAPPGERERGRGALCALRFVEFQAASVLCSKLQALLQYLT